MSGQRKYVWLLRHGERYDCTDAQWKATAKRPHDPHLSQAGIQQAYAAGRLIHARTAQQREAAELADVAIFTSPFLRCVQTAKSISTAYYDQLTGRPVSEKVDFDVQVKVEHGLAEFLTTLHFSEQLQPMRHEELNQVLEGELDKFYISAHPFPTFPETVSGMYHRYQATFLSLLSTCPASTVILVTHGYGLQVLTEFMSPSTLVTHTDFACITAAQARRTGRPPRPPRKPSWDHARLVPDPLPTEWEFECELLCDVAHWREDGGGGMGVEEEGGKKLANPLPEPEVDERKK